MTTDMEKELEAFEAWAKQHYGYRKFSLEPFLPISDHWRSCWAAWQARAALAAPAAPQEQPSDRDIALIWDQSTDEIDVPELRIQGDLLPLILAHSRALLSRYGAAPQPAPQDAPAKSIQWTEEAIVAAMEASVAGRPSVDDDSYVRSILDAALTTQGASHGK